MTARLLLVRHAESESNILRKLDTKPPGAALTKTGHKQARKLAELLALTDDDILVSSIAVRAQQTAMPIAESLGRSVTTVEGIHEIQAGDLELRSDHEAHRIYVATYTEWLHGNDSARIPGGESGHDLMDRYLPVISTLRTDYLKHTSGRIVVVSHGAAIRAIAAKLTGIDPGFALRHRLENTGGVELAPTAAGGWDLVRWGHVVSHSPGEAHIARDVMG
ncbi:histidine phosphatase family protein [Hoyosella rhizosphaerae]|uniref:Phosphoglycerate mutase n=1 Tax=Hoyosella rhizosphaerae TaxID=1755582 RepID=A0A916XEJ4_9ACTN|nr:histidine phosphatase family protein [Hoyosella rhizosphaerae]MBN4927409.1 histidine phosphatase family protein [Hoyosella rhizosphaerae]GGC64623.1 putative phosphoglycerate mutase [Hoyosella rhizosphaerae]